MYEDQHCDLTKVLTSREKTEKNPRNTYTWIDIDLG